MEAKQIKLEETAEELMEYSDDDLYNINSWGADLSFREIITMYEDEELLKPELQKKYVWTRTEASRFIDSILLGLPVPSVFFAKEQNETMLIIDGFQRIMTVYDYVKGIFSGDGKIFKLSNTENINARWRGKAFAELDIEEKRRIRNTTINAIIFEQKHPRILILLVPNICCCQINQSQCNTMTFSLFYMSYFYYSCKVKSSYSMPLLI